MRIKKILLAFLISSLCACSAQTAPTLTQSPEATHAPEPTIINPIQTVTTTSVPFIFIFPFDKQIHIAAINFFDIDQKKGYDADLNDTNGTIQNAICDKRGGTAYNWISDKISGLKFNTLDGHRGIDFYVPDNTIIMAPYEGEIRIENNTMWIRNGDLQTVIDHVSPMTSLNGGWIEKGQPIAMVTPTSTKGVFKEKDGINYYEFHFGLMIKDKGMSNGWRSIDPLYEECSNDKSNPWKHTIWLDSDLPNDFKALISSLKVKE